MSKYITIYRKQETGPGAKFVISYLLFSKAWPFHSILKNFMTTNQWTYTQYGHSKYYNDLKLHITKISEHLKYKCSIIACRALQDDFRKGHLHRGMLLDISFTEVVVFRPDRRAHLLLCIPKAFKPHIGCQKCNTEICITVPLVHWGKTRHLAGPS